MYTVRQQSHGLKPTRIIPAYRLDESMEVLSIRHFKMEKIVLMSGDIIPK